MNTNQPRRRGRPRLSSTISSEPALASAGELVQDLPTSGESPAREDAREEQPKAPAPKEAVSARAKSARRERRYSATMDGSGDRKLRVRGKMDSEFTYRWVSGQDGRVEELTERDWDVVEGQPAVNMGGETNVLMKKYKDWHEEDRRAQQARVDVDMEAINRGIPAKQDANLYSSDPLSTLSGPKFEAPKRAG